MAHQSNGRGSAIIKRKFRGVPLIRRAVGTSDAATIRAVETMYDALYQTGRADILEAIARKRLHPLVVLARWRQGQEIALPPADVFPLLAAAWDKWADSIPASADHRVGIRGTGRALRIPADANITELPQLLADLRARCVVTTTKFNRARAHAQAFLRDTVGLSHSLYASVRDVRPYKRKPRTRGQPHSVQSIRELCRTLGHDAGLIAWTLAVTGMGPKEFWRDGFEVLDDRILIHGQKRDGRERTVPRWTMIGGPSVSLRHFRGLLKTASGGAVSVYDLRRSFARWTEEAGVIETNRAAYMGHGPKTMTALYSWGELPGQLAADAVLLARYAGEPPTRPMEVTA